MGLSTYHTKRHFARTPEPEGQVTRRSGPLRFVVQKHNATRLHYDFRLEAGGVLKSWAVPKGPSLNPADKRLAVMVEDHPLDYRSFEGIIPAGNYGAGEVIVWDQGTYDVPGGDSRRASEATLLEGLARGRVHIRLHGEKLRGEFTLVKLRRGGENNWLLMKKSDRFASTADVTDDDRSVVSGRTLGDVRQGRAPVNAGRTAAKARRSKRRGDAMPRDVRPMLATLVDQPFNRAGWLFEPKWDGYRAIAEVTDDQVRLYSRNLKPYDDKFQPVVESLRDLGHDAVLDGEVVVVDDAGKSLFQLLQNYQRTGKGRLLYYVFDLLYLDGRDLRSEPLKRRKQILKTVLGSRPHVRLGEHVEQRGVAFFEAAVAQGLEGIIAKDGASPYREGVRGGEWLKIKTRRRQEAVIAGFTEPRGSRKALGALVLGVYEDGELIYIGHTGGGLDRRGLADLHARLQPLERRQCPFRQKPATNSPVHWVEPRLVCEVTFQKWTDDGRMRQPIFVGLRQDKGAAEVHREVPANPARPASPQVAGRLKKPRVRRLTGKPSRTPQPGPALTNLDKVFWPTEGYTKGDFIAYYREIAHVLLPHLRDRPQSLHRHPDGIDGKSFYQKDVSRHRPPEWVSTVTIPPESGAGDITYVMCQDAATLLYLANLGCIELNPWLSRQQSLSRPDYLVIDLDPDDLPFAQAVDSALAVHKLLDTAGAANYCKTSGKRGLHVCVPLGAEYEYETARRFAEVIARLVHDRLPAHTSIVRSPALRRRKVYLDYLQNRIGQTLVAPYSVRPWPQATVSTPLKWSEVRRNLNPARFTIRTLPRRLSRLGDLWAPLLASGVDLGECLGRLERSGAGYKRAPT